MKKLVIIFSLLAGFLITASPTVLAAEGENPIIESNGTIEFYEESEKPVRVDDQTAGTNKPAASRPNLSDSAGSGKKYPATGEIIKAGIMYSGILLILIVLFLAWRRKRKEEVAEK